MSTQRWSWRYLPKPGGDASALPTPPVFTSQGDAESFIGEDFQDLWEKGVEKVVLVRDEADVYTMSLAES